MEYLKTIYIMLFGIAIGIHYGKLKIMKMVFYLGNPFSDDPIDWEANRQMAKREDDRLMNIVAGLVVLGLVMVAIVNFINL